MLYNWNQKIDTLETKFNFYWTEQNIVRTGKDDLQDLVHRWKKSKGWIRLIEKEIYNMVFLKGLFLREVNFVQLLLFLPLQLSESVVFANDSSLNDYF